MPDSTRIDSDQISDIEDRIVNAMCKAGRRGDISTSTHVKLSLAQWAGCIVFVLGVVGSIVSTTWRLGEDRAEYSQEMISVRRDLESAVKDVTHALEGLDSKWQITLRDATDPLQDAVAEVRNKLPDQFPPSQWVDTVYQRDIQELRREIQSIKEDQP